jgi:hypothetical protein
MVYSEKQHHEKKPCLLVPLVFFITIAFGQSYDIVIKGGHLIDPKNNIDAVRVILDFTINWFKVEGKQKFECEMTIKDGKIVYDLNGIANPVYVKEKK